VAGVEAPAVLGLQELLLGQKFPQDLAAERDARVWTIERADFNRLVQDHPDLGLFLFQEMSQGLSLALEVHFLNPSSRAPPPSFLRCGQLKFRPRWPSKYSL